MCVKVPLKLYMQLSSLSVGSVTVYCTIPVEC